MTTREGSLTAGSLSLSKNLKVIFVVVLLFQAEENFAGAQSESREWKPDFNCSGNPSNDRHRFVDAIF